MTSTRGILPRNAFTVDFGSGPVPVSSCSPIFGSHAGESIVVLSRPISPGDLSFNVGTLRQVVITQLDWSGRPTVEFRLHNPVVDRYSVDGWDSSAVEYRSRRVQSPPTMETLEIRYTGFTRTDPIKVCTTSTSEPVEECTGA